MTKKPLRSVNRVFDEYRAGILRTDPACTKSATTLLEESKGKYVKSETVLNTKQRLRNWEHLQVGKRYKNNQKALENRTHGVVGSTESHTKKIVDLRKPDEETYTDKGVTDAFNPIGVPGSLHLRYVDARLNNSSKCEENVIESHRKSFLNDNIFCNSSKKSCELCSDRVTYPKKYYNEERAKAEQLKAKVIHENKKLEAKIKLDHIYNSQFRYQNLLQCSSYNVNVSCLNCGDETDLCKRRDHKSTTSCNLENPNEFMMQGNNGRSKSPSPRILRRQKDIGCPGKLNRPDSVHSASTLMVPETKGTTSPVLRRRPRSLCTLQRSRSDLSHRYCRNSGDFSDLSSRLSRTSTDLERFFNEMGLDNTILEPMLSQQIQTKDSMYFESISTLDTNFENLDSRSVCSISSRRSNNGLHLNLDLDEKTPQQNSVVEKNARIIKWLCSVRKAHSTSD